MAFAGALVVGPCIIVSSRPTARLAVSTFCSIRTDESVHTFLVFLTLVVSRARTQYLWLSGVQVIVVRQLWVLAKLDKRSPFSAHPATDIVSKDETTDIFENILSFVQRIHVFVVLQLRTLGLAGEDLPPDLPYVPSRLQQESLDSFIRFGQGRGKEN